VANQLVHCGTSAPPNYAEACGAESKKDFTHKLGICLKELRETCVWLRLIMKSKMLANTRLQSLFDEGQQLTKFIGKSIATAKGVSKTRSS
jgi:four helix bundle protein